MNENDRIHLLLWYRENHRHLPWRENRDPYRIWISETMLQQTTTTTVLRFYSRFLHRFPTIQSLAQAPIEEVYEFWAGLGYYSRARNLHAASKRIIELKHFPTSYKELIRLPGFGPYTARAVSSLAFSEPVGVLDGNVIRVLTRKENLGIRWWGVRERRILQNLVDDFVNPGPSHELNQALMELGAQICTPKSPHCSMCPWFKICLGRKKKTLLRRPQPRPRRPREIWLWTPQIQLSKNFVFLKKNNYAPFLKGTWFLPGHAKKLSARPKRYNFRHSITHHDIFVQLEFKKDTMKEGSNKLSRTLKKTLIDESRWVQLEQLSKFVPASLVRKVIHQCIGKTHTIASSF